MFSTDQAYRQASLLPASQEAKLVLIRKDLDSWIALRPSCLEDSSRGAAQGSHHNGM